MSKISNILKTIKIIEGAKEPIRKKEIAEKVGVSERMIKKYIDDIKESGYINIISKPGAKGGVMAERAEEPTPKEPTQLTFMEKVYLKTILELNKKEVQEKIKYISDNEDKRELMEYNPIKKYLQTQLENILEIEYKLFKEE